MDGIDDFPIFDEEQCVEKKDARKRSTRRNRQCPPKTATKKRHAQEPMSGGYDCDRQRCKVSDILGYFDPFSDALGKVSCWKVGSAPPRTGVQAVYNSFTDRPMWSVSRSANLLKCVERHGERDFARIAESMASKACISSMKEYYKQPTSLACDRWYHAVMKPFHALLSAGTHITLGEFLSSSPACWLREEDDKIKSFAAAYDGGPIPRSEWASLQSALPRHAPMATIRRYRRLQEDPPCRKTRGAGGSRVKVSLADAVFGAALLTLARSAMAHDPYDEVERFIHPLVFRQRIHIMERRTQTEKRPRSDDTDEIHFTTDEINCECE